MAGQSVAISEFCDAFVCLSDSTRDQNIFNLNYRAYNKSILISKIYRFVFLRQAGKVASNNYHFFEFFA